MSSTAALPVETPPGPALSHKQVMVVFSGLMLGMLLAALDQTIVATALPTIVGDLHGESHLSWVVSAYLLTSTVSTPLYGKLSDLHGRKGLFQIAIVVFLVGSALSGLSQTMNELIAFRALQGIGAGGLMALSMAIIGDIVSARERGRYQGYFGAVFAFASIAGPLAGGFFVDSLSWRWVFYINIPVGIVALVVTTSALRLPYRRLEHRVDYLGALALTAGVSALLLVTVWGGSQYPWGSSTIVSLTVAGALLVTAFALWERKAPEPLLPPSLFHNGIFNVSSAISFLVAMSMFGAVIYLPFYLQLVDGLSAMVSGLMLMPLMAGVFTTSIVSGRLVTRTGRYKLYPILGAALMTVGMWLLSFLGTRTSDLVLCLDMLVLGAGMGMVLQNVVIATQNAVEFRDLGTATSALTFFRSLGGAFGTAFFGVIFVNGLNEWLPRLLPRGLVGKLRATASGFNFPPQALRRAPPAVRTGVIGSFVHALHAVFVLGVPITALTLVAAFFLREIRLRDVSGLFGEADPLSVPGPS